MKLKKKQKMKCKTYLLLGVLSIFLLLNFISATDQPTYIFNKVFFSPFYTGSTILNTNNTFSMSLYPPDKIQQVASAIVSFDVWMNPSVNFTLWVNNKTCNNPFYYISTTYAGAGKTQIYFDCSNVINHSGNYQIVLKSTKDTGAITGWIDIVYMNNPKGDLELFGTEYVNGQTAKVWLQLTDGNGTAVVDGVCYADIYYPDGSEFVERATMTNMNHDGIYYYDFLIDEDMPEGVYPSIATCYYEAGQTFYTLTNYTIFQGSYDSGTINDTFLLDGSFLRLKETPTNPVRNISVVFNSSSTICKNVSEALLTGMTIRSVTRFDSVANDDLTLSVWNYTSSSWIDLPNKALEGNVWRDVSNSVLFNNITKAGFVSTTEGIKLRINDTTLTDGATSNLDIDYLVISCDALSFPTWEELSGSSEVHISKPINLTAIAEAIWNFTDRNLTYTFDATNYTLINEMINNRTDVVNYTLINELINNRTDIVNYTLIADLIQDFNLTDQTNYTLIENLIYSRNDIVNYTLINELINNRTDIVNYTLINEMVQSLNITDLTNYTLIEELIQNRNDIVNYTLIWELIENQTRVDTTNYSLISSSVASSVWSYMGNVSSNILSAFQTALINPIASAVWTFSDRNLTYTEDAVNYSKVAEYVWLYENRNLTFYEVNNISADEIWNYMDRNLTFYPETNYTQVADYVWNYVDRNLTFVPINNISAEEIWNYYNRSLTDDIPLQVWSYPNRNLTTDIPFDVWNYENRTLTYYTINLTELIEMINNYEFNQTPIPYNDGNFNYYPNYQLNVTLYVIK